MEDFIEEYGGGEYQLIVYGPPKRGGLLDPATGRVAPKALTKPVRVVVPYYGDGGHMPNPEASFVHDADDDEGEQGEESSMREQSSGFRNPLFTRAATPANAKMLDSTLVHEREMHDRQRQERREERQQEERQTLSALEIVEQAAARREAGLLDQIRELKQERRQQPKPGSDLESVSSVIRAVMPNGAQGDVQSLREQHQREVERLEQHHKSELDSVRRTAAQDRERLEASVRHDREMMEARVRNAETIASDRVKTLEERMERVTKDAAAEMDRAREQSRAEHQRAMDALTKEHDRTVSTMKEHYEQRFRDEERQRQRDELMRKETLELQVASATTPLKAQVATLEAEISRLKTDVDHWKGEATRKGDLAKQVESFGRTAEQLGFSRDQGGGGDVDEQPKDLKSIFAAIGLNLAQNLPQLLESAGKTVASMRAGQQAPSPMGGMPMAPMMPQVTQPPSLVRQSFATEDSGMAAPQLQVDQHYPSMMPAVMPPPMPVADHQQPPPMPVAPPQASVPPAAITTTAPVAQPVPQQQVQNPRPATPARAPAQGSVELSPEAEQIVLGSREQMESWFETGVPVGELAPGLVEKFTPAVIRSYLPALTPEVVSAVLLKHGVTSPLVKRKGQHYLRDLHAALTAALQNQ
jgi:hypothetical protein